MTERSITFSFQGRYFKLGEISAQTTHLWFVLHGYGQLAQYFIRKFNALTEGTNHCIIAPEGLSHFYLDELQNTGRKSNRVGASWMTRENRLTDISNYLRYLDAIYANEVAGRSVPVTVLGFSQGAATATRWALHGNIQFSRLILWAGMLPPDMDIEKGSTVLREKDVHLVYGTRDTFLTDERFAEMKTLSAKLGTSIRVHTFDGDHEVDTPTLLKFK
jgi:predicted esterase